MLQYTRLARHFDVDELPPILLDHLPSGPLSFADFGCGDGPLLAALEHRPRAALCLATYADSIMSAQGKCWTPPDAQTRERGLALALAALDEAARARSIDAGRSLREERIAALAFATVDTA